MVKTGDSIFNVLLLVAMLLPLAPLLITFMRRVYHHAILNLLRVVCLFAFIRQLVLYIPGLIKADSSFAVAAFGLGEFILLFYLFKLATAKKRVKEFMNILLVSFISIIITIYLLRGTEAFPTSIGMIQSGVLIVLAVAGLLQLAGNRAIILFHEPLFWIAGGVICYAGMFLFMELLTFYSPGLSQQVQQEKGLVLSVVNICRFIFFTIAVLVAQQKEVDKDSTL